MSITKSAEEILAEIDAWFEEQIRRGPIAHAVEAYNQVFAARENLKERLLSLLGQAEAPKAAPPAAAPKKPAAPAATAAPVSQQAADPAAPQE